MLDTEYIDEHFASYESDSTHNEVASTNDTDSKSGTSEEYICDYCGQVFSQKSYLGAHMTKHRNGPAQTSFPCTVEGCSKVLKSRKGLGKHRLNIHKLRAEPRPKANVDGEKIVKLNCTQCPKWFTIQLKLDAHVRSYHQGLKVVFGAAIFGQVH